MKTENYQKMRVACLVSFLTLQLL